MTDYTPPASVTSDSAAPGSAWFNTVRANGEAIHRPPRARFIAMSTMDPSGALQDTNAEPIAAGTSGSIYWVARQEITKKVNNHLHLVAELDHDLDGLVELGRGERLQEVDGLGRLVGAVAVDLGRRLLVALASGHHRTTPRPRSPWSARCPR